MNSSSLESTTGGGALSPCQVLIVGGGSAGITVAARLGRLGVRDVAIIEPSATHYYQPLWTLVGAGAARRESTARPMRSVIPKGVRWIQDRVVDFAPDANRVVTANSGSIAYDYLVAAPGLQLDWDAIEGLEEALETPHVSSNYDYDLAAKTWQMIEGFRGGTAVFTSPPMPIKCAGAPQKIMYLAADHFRRRGVLAKSEILFPTATPSLFGVKAYADLLLPVVERYGIDVRFHHDLVSIDPTAREARFLATSGDDKQEVKIRYDIMHVTPPQSAPDFVKQSPLAGAKGWIEVDKHTLQHTRYAKVFGLGDVTDTPNAKTGAAVRMQAPVVAANLRAAIEGNELKARYDGYGSCPLVTSYKTMLLAEFDYSGEPTPTLPFIDTMKERRDMWYLKKYGLPFLYWNGMLRGIA